MLICIFRNCDFPPSHYRYIGNRSRPFMNIMHSPLDTLFLPQGLFGAINLICSFSDSCAQFHWGEFPTIALETADGEYPVFWGVSFMCFAAIFLLQPKEYFFCGYLLPASKGVDKFVFNLLLESSITNSHIEAHFHIPKDSMMVHFPYTQAFFFDKEKFQINFSLCGLCWNIQMKISICLLEWLN